MPSQKHRCPSLGSPASLTFPSAAHACPCACGTSPASPFLFDLPPNLEELSSCFIVLLNILCQGLSFFKQSSIPYVCLLPGVYLLLTLPLDSFVCHPGLPAATDFSLYFRFMKMRKGRVSNPPSYPEAIFKLSHLSLRY